MCLGIPGKILSLSEGDPLCPAKVNFGGITKEISLAFVPEARCGDYVIVHAGFALTVLDEGEALETLDYLRQMGEANGGSGE